METYSVKDKSQSHSNHTIAIDTQRKQYQCSKVQ